MKILLIEDSPLIRGRIVEMLDGLQGVVIVGQVEGPAAALFTIAARRPDVILLDLQLTGGSGIDVLREVRDIAPDVVPIVLTNFTQPLFRKECLAAGARYFFDKTTEFTKVRDTLIELMQQRH